MDKVIESIRRRLANQSKNNTRMYCQENTSRSVFYSGKQDSLHRVDVMLNDTGSSRDWACPRYEYLAVENEADLLSQLNERYGAGWEKVYGFPTDKPTQAPGQRLKRTTGE